MGAEGGRALGRRKRNLQYTNLWMSGESSGWLIAVASALHNHEADRKTSMMLETAQHVNADGEI